MSRFIGQSVLRKEDARLLTGHGRYLDDVVVPGMLHAAFVRSPVARGVITRLDVTAARALDGVRAVFTAADFAGRWHAMWPSLTGPNGAQPPARPLADGDVRFVGDPVAVVVAESRYLAEDACELVELDIDPLRPVLDYEQAAANTDDVVHPEYGTNVATAIPSLGRAVDDPDLLAVFAGAAHVVTDTVRQHRSTNVPMETRGVIAAWDGVTRRLEVIASTQSASEYRSVLARFLDVPERAVHVVAPDVGGAFGQKGCVSRDEFAVVLASVCAGAPVKWAQDRHENLIAANHARIERAEVTMAFDADGHFLAVAVDHLDDVGAYPLDGLGSYGFMVGMMFPGPYRIPMVGFRSTSVYTNTCGRAAYRGPWQIETAAREAMLDVAARQMAIDPLELRRRNVVTAADQPFTNGSGMAYDAISPAETLEQAAALLGYDDARRAQASARHEGRFVGIGIGLYVEPTGAAALTLSSEAATVAVDLDGGVTVSVGCVSHGQSLETTIPQVVADSLGVHVDAVVLVQGDTATTPFGGITGGSRSAVMYSGAASTAAARVRDKVVAIAAHAMEAAPEDLDVDDGLISVRGTPSRSMSLAEVAHLAYTSPHALPPGTELGLESAARFTPSAFATFSNACHMTVCEVDPTTGTTRVDRYVTSEDCGVVINPMVVHGQVAGGVVQGIGGVLLEHFVYDERGNPLTTTFLDYLLPSAADVPMLEYGSVVTPSPSNPGGHKGMGEGGAIGAVPTIVNAVADALAPALAATGARVVDQPLGPEQVFALLSVSRAPALPTGGPTPPTPTT